MTGLDDHVVEFEITPNRPDCLSVIGLAREAAATFNQELRLHTPEVKGGAAGSLVELLDVETPAAALCPRYTARMVRNVKIAPSPKWMRERLRSMGCLLYTSGTVCTYPQCKSLSARGVRSDDRRSWQRDESQLCHHQ